MPKRTAKKTAKKTTKKRGEGFLGDLFKGGLKILAPVLVDQLAGLAKRKVAGMGAKKKKKATKRKGTSVRVKLGRSVRI